MDVRVAELSSIQHHILLTPLYSEQLNNVYNFWGKIPIVCVTISHCGYWI